MESRSFEGLLEVAKRLQRMAAEGARAGANPGAAAQFDVGERVLAELRFRKERLNYLIRLLNAELRRQKGGGRPRRSPSRHRCRGISSGSPARPV